LFSVSEQNGTTHPKQMEDSSCNIRDKVGTMCLPKQRCPELFEKLRDVCWIFSCLPTYEGLVPLAALGCLTWPPASRPK